MAQVQCPNCGGYKVSEERVRVEMEYTAISSDKPRGGGLLLYLVVGVVFIVVLGINFEIPRMFIGFALIALVIAPFVVIAMRTDSQPNSSIYSCNICGFNWAVKDGEPEPEATVRPELILKGEQNLKEEEAERQRQAASAAAAARLLQQQRKK